MSLVRKVLAHGVVAVISATLGGLLVWALRRRSSHSSTIYPAGWEI